MVGRKNERRIDTATGGGQKKDNFIDLQKRRNRLTKKREKRKAGFFRRGEGSDKGGLFGGIREKGEPPTYRIAGKWGRAS